MYMAKGVSEYPLAQSQGRARLEKKRHAALMLHRRRVQQPLSPAALLLPV
jgi:hypothetical protein